MFLENQEILDLLHLLVEHQVQENQQRPQSLITDNSGGLSFNSFLDTVEFQQTYALAIKAAFASSGLADFQEIHDRFAGKIFQDISYLLLNNLKTEGEVLLNPSRTMDLFQILYPMASVIYHPLGLGSLEGISVPDGLLVQPQEQGGKIKAICEYTLAYNEIKINNKVSAFHHLKRRLNWLFAPEAYCLFVVPQDSQFSQDSNYTEANLITTPFMKSSFGSYFRNIIWQGLESDPDQASIYEISQYMESKRHRLEANLVTGNLTEADLYYLKRFAFPSPFDQQIDFLPIHR